MSQVRIGSGPESVVVVDDSDLARADGCCSQGILRILFWAVHVEEYVVKPHCKVISHP